MRTAATATPMPKPTLSITLEPPETIRCGKQVYRTGGHTYRAVAAVATAEGGATTVRDLAVAVWGERIGPEVSRGTIKTAVHRANEVLAGIGARERILIDGDVVLLG